MIKLDKDALICDLAETYNIYDYEQLPILKVAVLACGLRDDSRIKVKLSGTKVSYDKLILAGIMDRLSLLVYANTKDAQKGRNKPKMITDEFLKDESKEIQGFISGKDFEKRRREIIESTRR